MYIKNLALTNFRNFAEVESITFPVKALLVAAAPNATGKTNFLEALLVLLRGKSFRSNLEDCVRWDQDSFLLRGEVVHQQGEAQIAVRYHMPSRKLRIEENSVPASPVTFFSHYPVVVFLPEDTFMFNRGPALRRSFLNSVLLSSPLYLSALVQYHRALKQRNTALKNKAPQAEVAAWTGLLVEHSATLWNQRQSLVSFITTHLPELYRTLSAEERSFDAKIETIYDPEAYQALLEKSYSLEQRYGYTLYGPHRDDLVITTDSRPLQNVLSRGQLRSVVIALKIAAHRYITQTTHEEPLLLLDEVLSELDESRQNALLSHLPDTQILLTCTTIPAVLQQRANVHLLDLRSIVEQTPPAVAPAALESVGSPVGAEV